MNKFFQELCCSLYRYRPVGVQGLWTEDTVAIEDCDSAQLS